MSKGIIEKTQKISSKMTTFIWFLGMCNLFKMDKYYETEGVLKNVELLYVISYNSFFVIKNISIFEFLN